MTEDTPKFIHIFLKNSEHVIYGDNNKGKIVGVRKIGMNYSTSTKKNILIIDDLKHSLLSIYQLCDKDLLVSFDSHIFQQVVSRNDTLNDITCSTSLIYYKLLNVFFFSAYDLFFDVDKWGETNKR